MLNTTTNFRHVVFFSGGICSYIAAKRVMQQTHHDETVLLFCDTHAEDEDLYRFLHDTVRHLKARLIMIDEGRTPWQVFHDERLLGNSRVDPCSKILKRKLARQWVNENCNPEITTLYLGLSWYERERIAKNRTAWKPWITAYPAAAPPLLDQCDMLKQIEDDGLDAPNLYRLGFEHNNCGGACVKGGHAQWRHLLAKLPERYAEHEEAEHQLRVYLKKNVTILRDTAANGRRPLTLESFRHRCQLDPTPKPDEIWQSCPCFTDPDEKDLAETN
jgi:hypothetical protein